MRFDGGQAANLEYSLIFALPFVPFTPLLVHSLGINSALVTDTLDAIARESTPQSSKVDHFHRIRKNDQLRISTARTRSPDRQRSHHPTLGLSIRQETTFRPFDHFPAVQILRLDAPARRDQLGIRGASHKFPRDKARALRGGINRNPTERLLCSLGARGSHSRNRVEDHSGLQESGGIDVAYEGILRGTDQRTESEE